MRCVMCGQRTRVVDSRPSDSTTTFGGQRKMRELVSWYTRDWVYRRRQCLKCTKTVLTVEILLEDLEKGWSPKDK